MSKNVQITFSFYTVLFFEDETDKMGMCAGKIFNNMIFLI